MQVSGERTAQGEKSDAKALRYLCQNRSLFKNNNAAITSYVCIAH